MNTNAIQDGNLHALVDGALSEAERDRVERLLAESPEDAQRVEDYCAQKQAIRSLFVAVLDEPVPERLRALAVPPVVPVGLFAGPLWRIAAVLLVGMFGVAAGWIARGAHAPADTRIAAVPLPRQAAIAHAVYTPDVRRPVEVSGQQEEQLVTWLSKRIGAQIRAPKLGALGYELVGGRLLPGNVGPVAQFMYQDASGQRLTLYISTENTRNRETAFRFAQEGQVNVFYWIDGTFGYALSASVDKGELAQLATAVYEQFERRK